MNKNILKNHTNIKIFFILFSILINSSGCSGTNSSNEKNNSDKKNSLEVGVTKVKIHNEKLSLISYPQGGILVEKININSRNLGVIEGDIIKSINNSKINTPENLMETLRGNSKNATHILTIIRNNKEFKVKINSQNWLKFITPTPPTPPSKDRSIAVTPPEPPKTN